VQNARVENRVVQNKTGVVPSRFAQLADLKTVSRQPPLA
jgi:hypothetical protein